MPTFIEEAVAGRVEMDEIDDYIDEWHDSPDDNGTLMAFLGMTEPEYESWALNPDVLPHIITAHRNRGDFASYLRVDYEQRIAARTDAPDKLALIQTWLDEHS